MPGNVAREVEGAERRVGAGRVAHQPADVRAHLQRVSAADESQVVHELERLALVDAFPARAVAEPVEPLDVDRRKPDLVLVWRASVRPADQHPVDPEILLDREPGVAPWAEPIEVPPHVAEAHLVQKGGAPGRYVLNRRAVVVEETRHREVGVDGNRGVVPPLVDIVAEDFLALAEDVVDARDELIDRVLGAGDPAEVVGAGLVRQGLVLVDHRHRQRIEPVRRDDVVRERKIRQRIPDRDAGDAREVAGPHRFGEHVGLGDALAGFARALVRAHEERLVAPDRPANHAAELVPIELGLGARRRREEVARIHRIVAHVVEDRPAEVVGAGLELQLHVGAGMPAVLRRIVGGLHLELLDRIHGRVHEEVVPAVVERADAVERHLLVHATRPAGAELGAGGDDAGGEVAERREVPSAQGQVHEGLGADDVAGDTALCLEEQPLRFDVDHFADGPDLQREVQPRHLSDAQRDVGALGPEPGQGALDNVVAGGEIADLERAVGTAHDGVDDARRVIGDGDVGARDQRAAAIHDGPEDSGVDRLRPQRRSKQQDDRAQREYVMHEMPPRGGRSRHTASAPSRPLRGDYMQQPVTRLATRELPAVYRRAPASRPLPRRASAEAPTRERSERALPASASEPATPAGCEACRGPQATKMLQHSPVLTVLFVSKSEENRICRALVSSNLRRISAGRPNCRQQTFLLVIPCNRTKRSVLWLWRRGVPGEIPSIFARSAI